MPIDFEREAIYSFDGVRENGKLEVNKSVRGDWSEQSERKAMSEGTKGALKGFWKRTDGVFESYRTERPAGSRRAVAASSPCLGIRLTRVPRSL